MSVIKSPMMIVLTLFVSLLAFLRLYDGGIPVFEVLFAVSLWGIWLAKDKATFFRIARGTGVAVYVINWIAVGLSALGGAALLWFRTVLGQYLSAGEGVSLRDLFIEAGVTLENEAELEAAIDNIDAFIATTAGLTLYAIVDMALILLAFLLLLIAVVTLIYNVFFCRSLYKTCGGLHAWLTNGTVPEKTGRVRKWLLVLGVWTSITALSVFDLRLGLYVIVPFSAVVCEAVICFLAYALFRRITPDGEPIEMEQKPAEKPVVTE